MHTTLHFHLRSSKPSKPNPRPINRTKMKSVDTKQSKLEANSILKSMSSSSLALRRAGGGASSLLVRLVNQARTTSMAPAVRLFNTNGDLTRFEGEGGRVEVDQSSDRSALSRRRDWYPTAFSGAFDPFFRTRNINQMFDVMDRFMENPFMSPSRGRGSSRGWDVREDDNALYLRVDMPGLDKDQVKISVEQNTLVIKGKGERESEGEEYRRRYLSRLDLSSDMYKLNSIKAEMKNGVLKVMVPKVAEEKRTDVFPVSVE